MLLLMTCLVLCGYAPAAYALTHTDAKPPRHSMFFLVLTLFFMAHILGTTLLSGLILQNFSQSVYSVSSIVLTLCAITASRTYILPTKDFLVSIFASARNLHLPHSLGMRVSLGIFSLMLLLSLIRIHFAPPNVFDTQVYHLTIPLTWLHDNHMTLAEDVPVGRLNYATKLSKALAFWHVRLDGTMTYVELSQLPAFALLLIASYALLIMLKTPRSWAVFSTLLVASIPIVMIEASTLQDHILLTALHLTFLALCIGLCEKWLERRSWVLIASLCIALLLASKFSAPAHMAVLGLGALLAYRKDVWSSMKHTSWKSWLVSIFIVIALGGIWYMANMSYYGSPFGPKHAQSQQQNIFMKNVRDIPLRIFDQGYRYTPDLIGISGFGPHVAMFGWVGIWGLIYSRKFNRHHIFILATSATILGIYFTQYYTLYNYRLFMFVPVTVLIVAMSYLATLSPKVGKTIRFLAPIGMLYTCVMIQFPDYVSQPIRAYRDLYRHYPESRTAVRFDYGSDKFKRDASWLFIDQYVPNTEPILFITQNKGAGYDDNVLAPYYNASGTRDVYWGGDLHNSKFFTPDGLGLPQLESFMKERNIHYLHNNSVFYYDPVQLEPGSAFIQLTPQLWYLR